MASRTRRAKVALAAVALALVGLGAWRGEALWRWATTSRVYVERHRPFFSFFAFSWGGPKMRGWKQGALWPDSGLGLLWYVDSGFKAEEYFIRDGNVYITRWRPDGSVLRQDTGIQAGPDQSQETPPWLWGVTDQTEPTMPEWMNDDEQWAKALEEAR